MDVRWFVDDKMVAGADLAEGLPANGFVWLDYVRAEADRWPSDTERLTGTAITPEHKSDSFNAAHPSFFDGTNSYDMVIFRELASTKEPRSFDTTAIVLFVFDRLLVTVRDDKSDIVTEVTNRIRDRRFRTPRRPIGLAHRLLSAVVDRYMSRKEPLIELISEWQNRLLDPDDPFDDWLMLMKSSTAFRRLEVLCEHQEEAIRAWREETVSSTDENLMVRFTDLQEHIRRVFDLAKALQHQIESVVQLHFAATAHRTNNIMKVLTVVAAIFLPLTLIAGIFGMNFENMPELKWPYAYPIVLSGMFLVGIGLVVTFKRRRWI